mmetsp:Transcript_3524/g.4489  ORF Transcript_3524/g.4489 Transcript_3524/m.4489 type:complete len:836 (+) Transcript_3524:75-2582(+)
MNLSNPCELYSSGWTAFPCNSSSVVMISLSLAASMLAVFMVIYLTVKLQKYPRGNDKMNEIATLIQNGAKSFLKTEYKYLFMFIILASIPLIALYSIFPPSGNISDGVRITVCFVAGAAFSALAGWVGMIVATEANVRTTQAAANEGLGQAFRVAFGGGSVMGFAVAGLSLFGLSLFLVLMTVGQSVAGGEEENNDQDLPFSSVLILAVDSLVGFGFGASSIALFARVAGGIYTKAADVGADLVGKVEMNIPEDDPRNPAVIADNVGDNVGDVAGMGADLFEGLVGSVIAAATLAEGDVALIMLPFWIMGVGIVACVGGCFTVGLKETDGSSNNAASREKSLTMALHKGTVTASVLALAFCAIICSQLFEGRESYGWKLFLCIAIGLIAGIIIGQATEFFTSYSYFPVQSITSAGKTGPATVIIQGLGMGMLSCVPSVLLLVATIMLCNALAGDYGIAIAAVGMLSTLAINLATDAYGPIADNAGGIAEMACLDKSVRDITDALDAVGNTTAATGKGFSIGSAVLTSLSLLTAFKDKTQVDVVDLSDPVVLSGVLMGAMLPFLFAALTMLSVQKAAGEIINEVRRQFEQIPGLRDGETSADSTQCIAIATQSSIEEIILPGMYAILSPLIVGFLIGPKALTGLLGGSIASGMMLAIMMANAGGAWDNAKKFIESYGEEAGGGKGSAMHKACVVADTVGDPFKDTSGPALNILIKLMCMVSLTIAPIIAGWEDWQHWFYGLFPVALLGLGHLLVYQYIYHNNSDDGEDETTTAEMDDYKLTPDANNDDVDVEATKAKSEPLRQFLQRKKKTKLEEDMKSASLLTDDKDPHSPGKLV